jgi:hypothetical protein
MNIKIYRFRKIAILTAIAAGLSTLTFNCAPGAFQSARQGASSMSSSSAGEVFSAPLKSPYVVMTVNQTYQTMLNVTGQTSSATAGQRDEFAARAGALADNPRLSNVSSPFQLAATSLAGEVCNGALARETAQADAARVLFQGVNFGATVSANSAAYRVVIDRLAESFWNRDLTASELAMLNTFYNEFITDLGAAATQTAQTRTLFLSACTGMLGSLDTYMY